LKLVKGGLGLTAYRLMGWPRRTVGLPGPEVEVPGKATGTRRIGSSPEGAMRPKRLHSMAMLCIAMHGMTMPVGGGPCESRSRPALEPTGDDRARGPDIRLPSAGPSWSVPTTSNPSVPTRSFSSGRLPAVSPFRYVPATSQAPYRLRSRLRSSQGGMLRGFDGGFGGLDFGAGNPTMAKGYGQSPSTITIAMLTRWGRFPGAGLGLRCSVSGPRCRVPGTEEGNRAIRRNARLMLRRRAHGVCYAKHSMAMQCHRLSLKSLGHLGRSPGSCPKRIPPAVGRGRPDGRDHIQSHSVHVCGHMQST
jgi:hypothetical protein